MRALPVIVALAVICAAGGPAQGRPSDGKLLGFGAALAPPTYFFGVTLHEGSHAVVAELFGADVTEFHVLPYRNPDTGRFFFGYVKFEGRLTKGQFATFLLAPRIVDLVLLSTYGALVLSGNVPDNRYGQMAMAVVATGLWVDFSKDIFVFHDGNDVVKVYRLMGHKTLARELPLRVLHAGISTAAAYIVYRGYKGVFAKGAEPAPMMIPVLSGSF